ncbi:hypothetical protein L1887_06055 [Cichorium endivia]|nr:hypothetical protein L1887_06055 [Cichorium endivia]
MESKIHGDSVEGRRILCGNSPCKLIEQFTELIRRPPVLPDWIISGAIVGMQGGTNSVRHVWEELVAYDVPISAFWLQVFNTAFVVGMLDLTHPHTASWFKKILQEMVDDGVWGWMADFSEGLPLLMHVSTQIHGDSVEGRILYGNSPCELIEQFTESIRRPPVLPDWIISGAIVGMQDGTTSVCHVWEELVAYDVPISAFWLQTEERGKA